MKRKNQSVLIVDDEGSIRDLLFEELNGIYDCSTASDGKEALSKLAEQHFDAVLLDIRLPDTTGIELLKELMSKYSDIAVIMITALTQLGTAVEAMKLGASDYIVKPFDLETITTSLSVSIKAKREKGKALSELDAIARGVEEQLISFPGYSDFVINETKKIAQRLEIDEEEIKRWIKKRQNLQKIMG